MEKFRNKIVLSYTVSVNTIQIYFEDELHLELLLTPNNTMFAFDSDKDLEYFLHPLLGNEIINIEHKNYTVKIHLKYGLPIELYLVSGTNFGGNLETNIK